MERLETGNLLRPLFTELRKGGVNPAGWGGKITNPEDPLQMPTASPTTERNKVSAEETIPKWSQQSDLRVKAAKDKWMFIHRKLKH